MFTKSRQYQLTSTANEGNYFLNLHLCSLSILAHIYLLVGPCYHNDLFLGPFSSDRSFSCTFFHRHTLWFAKEQDFYIHYIIIIWIQVYLDCLNFYLHKNIGSRNININPSLMLMKWSVVRSSSVIVWIWIILVERITTERLSWLYWDVDVCEH